MTQIESEEELTEDTMTDAELRGMAEPDSSRAKETQEDYNRVKELVREANVPELLAMYEKAIRQRNEMEELFLSTCEFHLRKTTDPRMTPLGIAADPSVVGSMEKVALAAVGLATLVVNDVSQRQYKKK